MFVCFSALSTKMSKMNTILFTIAFFFTSSATSHDRSKRGSFVNGYSYSSATDLSLASSQIPVYSLGIDTFLPFPTDNYLSPPTKLNIAPVAYSNSVEKPVQEASDSIPQPPTGTAVIPLQPPPAVPVSAAAARVPGNNGAVFLGSGALGVINLGNGAFALGSGGIGYSDVRQQPRPNGRAPLFPPLPASPNLIPAATPSQQPISIPQSDTSGQSPQGYEFDQPLFVPHTVQRQFDQNGYERLQPSSAGFGMQMPRVRPLKTRMNFATATMPQISSQLGIASQLPNSGFGDPIPTIASHAIQYYQ